MMNKKINRKTTTKEMINIIRAFFKNNSFAYVKYNVHETSSMSNSGSSANF